VRHLGRSVGTSAGPRSQPLSLCDAPPTLGESLAGGALLVGGSKEQNVTLKIESKKAK
jgi:hypothetical protein